MLYHALRYPGSGLYHGQLAATLEGPLDEEPFRRAWAHAADRHEVFRTFYTWEKRDRPLQVVRSAIELPIRFLDWRSLDPAEAARRWTSLLGEDRRTPLNLTQAPMMRLTVAHLSETRHEFLWGVHHSILDGWSGELVLGEVLDDVAALGRGEALRGGSAPSYAEFVGWLDARDRDEVRSWWREELEGVRRASKLPVPETGRSSSVRLTTERALSADQTLACRTTASDRRVTLASLTVAAWSILLARRTGTRDALFGITMSERPAEISGVHDAAGLYLSTIPARVPLDLSASISEWLLDVQRRSSEARSRASLGLSELKRLSDVEGPEWIQSLVVFENFPESIAHSGNEGALRIAQVSMAGPSDLPLALLVYPGPVLTLQIVHDPEKVSVEQAEALLLELSEILDGLGAGAETVGDLLGSHGDAEPPMRGPALEHPPTDVMELFGHWVATQSDRVAVRAGGESWTYAALDREATAIAGFVRAHTTTAGGVGILAERGAEAVAAMLGVLKAGRFYLPLDPALPSARIATMVESADLVLTGVGCDLVSGDTRVSSISAARASGFPKSGSDEPSALNSETAAYVIHTSGSTGTPKGVVVERRQLAWSTAARLAYYEKHPGVFLLLSAISVDSSVAGIYWTLCAGGTLVLPPVRAEQDVVSLGALIQQSGVSHTLMVPSLYRALLSEVDPAVLSTLEVVVVAGEACAPDVVRSHRSVLPGVPLYNEYGPSEASVWATVDELTADPGEEVTIGRPVPGALAWVVDDQLRPVPAGEVGELLLGGAGVARGYLGRPDLTDQRFFSYPKEVDDRVYRTGDRARWRPDGRLDFIGRSDHQIKLRGYRVEAAEIEGVLRMHGDIDDAVVGLSERDGRELLTAWVCAVRRPGEASLKSHLAASLPDYMIPRRFVLLDSLPRTRAGKIDRAALAGVQGGDLTEAQATHRVAPRTPEEQGLAEVWADVLGVAHIGVHDDFFALGGDSLLSIRVISRAARMGLRIDPESFFENPTIAHIAALGAPESSSYDAEVVTGSAPLTPIHHWFLETITTGSDHWNQAEVLDLAPGIEAGRVERAVRVLLEHHDGLRMRLDVEASPPRQVIEAPESFVPFRVVELTESGADADRRIEVEADREHVAVDLGRGPLFRTVLFTFDDSSRLLIVAHHLVVDTVSWSIIFDDLAALLAGDESEALPSKTASVLAWSAALERRASEPDVREMASHWTSVATPTQWATVPCDISGSDGAGTVSTSQVHRLVLDPATTAHLMPKTGSVDAPPLHHTLLAGLLLAWGRWTGRDGLQLHVEGLGRDTLRGALDASRTVGWFTSVYPLRLPLPEATPDVARRALREAIDGLPLGGAAYGLARYLHPDPELRRSLDAAGSAEMLFNFLGTMDGALATDAPFERSSGPRGSQRSAEAPRAYRIEINAFVQAGQLHFVIESSTALHHPQTIEAWGGELRQALSELAFGPPTPTALDRAGISGEAVVRAGLRGATDIEDIYPLTPMQGLMLLHEVGTSVRGLLTNQICYEVTGPIDADTLRYAVELLVLRHPSLRGCVLWEGLEEPLQVVRTRVDTPFEVVDLRDLPSHRAAAVLEEVREADSWARFDLREAPLMRLTLVHLSPERARLIWTLHHLVADRWSFGRIVIELGQLYRSIREGGAPDLEPAAPFRDYVSWLQERDDAETDRFWTRALAGFTTPTHLAATALADPGERETHTVTLPIGATEVVGRAAIGARMGPSAFVLGAIALETGRRTARRDVVVGLTVSGRPPELIGVEDIVGSFVNNVPLRVRIDPERPRDAWLREIQLGQVRRRAHEHLSLARIHGLSDLSSSAAMFDLLVVINLDEVQDPDFGEFDARPTSATFDGGYPLILEVARASGHLRLRLIHPRDSGEASALLERLATTLQTLAGASGDSRLDEIFPFPDPVPDAASTERPERTRHEMPRIAAGSDAGRVVRNAWTEVLGLPTARPSDDFFTIGGTSLQGAQLLARIEVELGRRIPIAVLVSGRTLGALLEAVDAPHVETGPLVLLRGAGARAPLIAVPGVAGDVLLYPPLAGLLRPGRPVYGLQSRGVDGEAPFLDSMEAIAIDFVEQLGPLTERPLHLFGLCWGAAAAFEIAAVLEARGTPPASVALLDPTALGLKVGPDGRSRARGRTGFVLDRLTMYVEEFKSLDWPGRRRFLSQKSARLSEALRGRTAPAAREELRKRAMIESNLKALRGYQPARVSSPARVFLAEDYEPDFGYDHRIPWLSHFDPAPSVVPVPGFDSGDVIKAHTGVLAASVDAWLDEVESGS
jgi:amino acid adenylation domain-containing protein/non-ribosomal peptide synthase protein (TIGR01720 family)